MMQKATLSVFATLIGTSGVGIVGANLLLLLLFAFHMKLRTDTWALSLNLSICDLTFGIAVIPVAVYNSLSGGGIFSEDGTACHLMGFLFVLLHLASLNSLVCATIDKFTEICFPLRYPQLITKRRIWIILALVWIYAAVVASFPFMGFGKYAFSTDVYICLPYFGSSTTVYSVLFLSVGVLGPITLISVLYIAIIQIARHQARRGTFVCNDQHCYYVPIRSYFKNTVILVVSAFYLVVCWVPMVIIGFYETFHSHDIPAMAKMVCTWLVVMMSGLNPWINSLAQRQTASLCNVTTSWTFNPKSWFFNKATATL
uniref:G-protein coupled receptors family 1 profile domain-containing protein n=1 Tax=Leptobrachium leishanense TaxID=445787 RepID=A0A8C5R4P1_9ANUR